MNIIAPNLLKVVCTHSIRQIKRGVERTYVGWGLLNMTELFITAIVSVCQMASKSDGPRVCWPGHCVQGSHLTEHQQVSTLPGCFSHSTSRHHLCFASGLHNCSCYVNSKSRPMHTIAQPRQCDSFLLPLLLLCALVYTRRRRSTKPRAPSQSL